MANNSNKENGLSDVNSVFLRNDLTEVRLGTVHEWSEKLRFLFKKCSSSHPLGIVCGRDAETALMIAGCWLQRMPVILLPGRASEIEQNAMIEGLEPCEIVRPKEVVQFKESGEIRWADPDNTILINDIPVLSDKTCENDIILTDSDPDDLFGVLFTSGTTGKPRKVPLCRRHILAAWSNTSANYAPKPNSLWLQPLPMHHIGGASVILRALFSGSGVRIADDASTEKLAEILSGETDVLAASMVPTQLSRLLEIPEFRAHDWFECMLLGGGPAEGILIGKAMERGLNVLTSFGMTETSALCIAMSYSNFSETRSTDENYRDFPTLNGLASCGKPLSGVEIRLEADSSDSPNSLAKLLYVRSDQVFNGYAGLSARGSGIDENGWFCTGDYACEDKEGNLFILIRRSDRIVSGGENVDPSEVEQQLMNLGLFKEVSVFGIENAEWGQVVCSAAVLNGSSLQLWFPDRRSGLPQENEAFTRHVQELLKGRLSTYKIPRRVLVLDSLPRTETGKLLRGALQGLMGHSSPTR